MLDACINMVTVLEYVENVTYSKCPLDMLHLSSLIRQSSQLDELLVWAPGRRSSLCPGEERWLWLESAPAGNSFGMEGVQLNFWFYLWGFEVNQVVNICFTTILPPVCTSQILVASVHHQWRPVSKGYLVGRCFPGPDAQLQFHWWPHHVDHRSNP